MSCRTPPTIECNSEFVDCEKVVKWLGDFPIACTRDIFVEDSPKLIERFAGDEEVEEAFTELGWVGKTRDRGTPYAQVLVAPDLIWKGTPDTVDISDQIVLTVLHEEAHNRGIKDERKAEQWAYQVYKEKSKSFSPVLTKR